MQVLPENPSDAMRCPVKFYEFYYSKCPEQARHPAGPFFLKPAPACTAESPVWFSCEPLGERDIEAMLTRLLLVRDAHVEPQLVSC
ncbi:ZMYM3 [Cordylochernes scorpioides]|uniref:ZMYM3 n=1 Tax=Cordylochernes scorpioides TaxID=51811 RepID=A0ABY6KEJ1_9ARAC|nr:ZMYM3 [Cordylochernes scorpioides]